jgi:tRNA(fMet)-specific endonuclease VapC
MLYMLDTDVASYIIKGGHRRVDQRVAATPPSDLCISAMTRAELKYGLAASPENLRLHALVQRFLGNTRLLAWGSEAADIHAQIKFQLRSAGTPIGEMDTLIAAHAIASDAVLVTNNTRHFEPIKFPLMLENWTK